jgi:hypothetical protein
MYAASASCASAGDIEAQHGDQPRPPNCQTAVGASTCNRDPDKVRTRQPKPPSKFPPDRATPRKTNLCCIIVRILMISDYRVNIRREPVRDVLRTHHG